MQYLFDFYAVIDQNLMLMMQKNQKKLFLNV